MSLCFWANRHNFRDTVSAEILYFSITYIRLSEGYFIIQATVFKFSDSLGGWKLATNEKFHYNISKITKAGPKTTGTWGENTTRH